ncbi:hypothetical protein HKD37_03G008041 [Glycine soja]|nr:hypothetical protein GmHk_03G008070 [Glycine max]
MRAVLVSVLPLPPSHRLSTQNHNPNSHLRFPSSSSVTSSTSSNRTIVFGVNPSDSKKDPSFFDENGAVNDMEGYLNHLSLEYDSVWDTKPSWCQPWTIALTGVSIIAISWLILHSVIITSLISSLICAWWYIFLYSYPKVLPFLKENYVDVIPVFIEIRENDIRDITDNSPMFYLYMAYSDMIAERRERVTNGVEDTFGQKKNQ